MCNAPAYTIHAHHHHFGWDRSIAPVETVAPGERVAFKCRESSDGQITASSIAADLAANDPARVNPVTGPIFVDGAEPGDVLKVEIEAFTPSGFGWTANIPGFGLLADQFPDPELHLWHYDAVSLDPVAYGSHARVPLRPFAGTLGVAPAEAGRHSIIPPRRVGGNLDIRDLCSGTTLYLPIEVAGALFSVGDTHAAQGDGEVCGTAIESAIDVCLKFDLIKSTPLTFPRFTTPGPVTRHLDVDGYEVTTGVGPDMMEGARNAVSGMIDLLCAEQGLAAIDAYMLASVCGDLRVSEVVDAPNWVMSFYMPRTIFN
ncbi:acetamidase/formamidase family protein [Amaricoccus macauensis]|uniref:acetamidase/formamidase family protein n=1 Tax=Amaricoccus macauensis TaxID=57001 RepID=UPI003C79FBBD